MSKVEAKLNFCTIVNQLNESYWRWSDEEKEALREKNTKEICQIIRKRLIDKGAKISNMYAIVHDKDTRISYDEYTGIAETEKKLEHIHIVIRFDSPVFTLSEIAVYVGVESQFVEKPETGRYSWDNCLAYLTHVKYANKYQYDKSEVLTICGDDYNEYASERWETWLKGRALIEKKLANVNVDWLVSEILKGRITKNQVLLSDDLYLIYGLNESRCEQAFDVYFQRKNLLMIRDIEEGRTLVTVIFITGKAGYGKSYFTDLLVDSIIQRVREDYGIEWSSCQASASNPIDDYCNEEILIMDDVRGFTMTASDWLKLLDPERVTRSSARYHNKAVPAKVIIINSSKDMLSFFYYVKGTGSKSDRGEAMDQFIRRCTTNVEVKAVPIVSNVNGEQIEDKERHLEISEIKESVNPVYYIQFNEERFERLDKSRNEGHYSNDDVRVKLMFTFDLNPQRYSIDDALVYLTDLVEDRAFVATPKLEKIDESEEKEDGD